MRLINPNQGDKDFDAVVVELFPEECIADYMRDDCFKEGEDIITKAVLTEIDLILEVAIPKYVQERRKKVLVVRKEKKRIAYDDAILMNRTLAQIFSYRLPSPK